VAALASSPGLAENKCIEVVAEEGAAAADLEDLLRTIPAEITKVGMIWVIWVIWPLTSMICC
jgi:hypothetical protein